MLDTEKLCSRAQEAFDKRNYDYAVDLARQIIELEPGHPKARHILRLAQVKKCESQGTRPSAISAIITGLLPFIKVFVYKTLNKPVKVLPAAEDFISRNPYSIWVRTTLADALSKLNYSESAINEFEGIVPLDPRRLHTLKSLGKLYIAVKDGKKAQQYFQAVMSINPSDLDAPRALKDIAALSTLKDGGWSEARSSRDLIKDKGVAVQLERDSQMVKESDIPDEIKRLNNLINQNPDSPENIKHLKRVGELYQRQANYEAAMETYQKAARLNPSDGALKIKVGDIRLLMFDRDLKAIQQKLQADPNNQPLKQSLQKIRQEKRQFQVEEYRRRVQLHPTDMALRFQLGVALYAGNLLDDAIAEFQNSVRDPKRKTDSLIYIGRCFMAKKIYDMAISQFTKALEGGMLSAEQTKDIHYNLGVSYEANKNPEQALAEYKKIIEIDINYKDTMKKIEQLQQSVK
jgi:tetratricopeptide (TPR) repeat protein